jgi:hypothetical protein
LDNGKVLRCTPDHKIPVLGKGFVEAKDLTANDPLIAFYTKNDTLSNDTKRVYTKVYDHHEKKWIFVHRLVANFFKDLGKHQVFHYLPEYYESVKDVVHHKDYNRFNNEPGNLQWMNFKDHVVYHSHNKQEYWEKISDEESLRVRTKISNTLKKYYQNLSLDEKRKISDESSVRNKLTWVKRKEDVVTHAQYLEKLKEERKKFYVNNSPAAQVCRLKSAENLRNNRSENQRIVLSHDLLVRVVELIKENPECDSLSFLNIASSDDRIIHILKRDNPKQPKVKYGINTDKFTDSKLKRIYKKFGFKDWRDLKEKAVYFNHRIVSVEYVTDLEDVGTITVDGQERWHPYHTFAIDSGIFVKNSTLEDYYFTTTADGRGSKVEVLPGGCLAMDTLVPLLDGRELSISDIEKEMSNGKKLWTYSCHPTNGEVVPGKISWAGVTHEKAKVMKLTFDNGKTLICTPEHKFPIMDIGFVRADELITGQKMIPSNRNVANIEYLEDEIQVGTLTIDKDEEYHNYHTFALSCGVFTKNSNLGEINDLLYFNNKMMRALGVPSSYLPTGPQDGSATMGDGKVGTAFIQEFRFSEKCKRYQRQLARFFDQEFKLFLKFNGVMIDSNSFEINFTEPQNFAKYREMELFAAQSSIFTAINEISYISKRFALKKYLGLTEEEIFLNEQLLLEEKTGNSVIQDQGAGLRQVGISSSDMAPMDDNLEIEGNVEPAGEGEEVDTNVDETEVTDSDIDNFGEKSSMNN